MKHEVAAFANGISLKLAARSRHVCVFLGAGASRACKLPDVDALQALVLDGLAGDDRTAFEHQLGGRNLEQALSRLRRIATLLEEGSDKIDGLSAKDAQDLDGNVCEQIVKALDLAGADLTPVLKFAAWVGRADYGLPLEIYSVNYDLLVETALEALGVPYFDGFSGALRARFRTELVEASPADERDWLPAFLVRLWKLHGSVNWTWDEGGTAEVVRLGTRVPKGLAAAIYPSDAKYDESRRVPFVVLQDRLRRALSLPETLMLISGYSFGDAHLNEMLFDAARRRPRSELIAFCYTDIPGVLAEAATRTPNLQVVAPEEAILGGRRGDWDDEGAALETDLWDGSNLALGDFANLAAFLARSSPPKGELEKRLGDLIANAATGTDA